MRILRSIVSIVSIVAAPTLLGIWYFQIGQDAHAPQDLKLGILVLALLVTLFSAFLALASVPSLRTALTSRNQVTRVTFNVMSVFFVIAFALLALYFVKLYLRMTR
jgi:RsiW-degrading membrane proteinase PrsW (M82 family)